MRLATAQFETKLQKCIRMGITIFKFFIWGDISFVYTFGNQVLRLRLRVVVKLNIRPYTSLHEKFEYSYPPILNALPGNLVLKNTHLVVSIFLVMNTVSADLHQVRRSLSKICIALFFGYWKINMQFC